MAHDLKFTYGICGIYKIQSQKKPGRIYIGMSKNIIRRWKTHLCELRVNKHISIKLQRHYNKYGEGDLQFSIITSCDRKELKNIEQFYLDAYYPYFNQCKANGGCFHK